MPSRIGSTVCPSGELLVSGPGGGKGDERERQRCDGRGHMIVRVSADLGIGIGTEWEVPLNNPAWFYKEAIEHQLQRLGAETWLFQGEQAKFRVGDAGVDGDVELSSTVYGATLRPASEVLETLRQLNDDVGDARIAEALLGAEPAGPS